jgi:hypothetical protein
MRTAIFVYQPTLISISTCEHDLELCGMSTATVPLSGDRKTLPFAPGVYKIDSCHDLEVTGVTGDTSLFDVVSSKKGNDPTPPARAASSLAPLDAAALKAFLSTPDAKQVVNP